MNSIEEERKLSEFISEHVISKASGRKDSECVGNFPRNLYFIGNLRPAGADLNQHSRLPKEFETKLSPVAFGGEFNILPRDDDSFISIKLGWSCYYRIFPSYQEQYRFHFQKDPGEKEEKNSTPGANIFTTGIPPFQGFNRFASRGSIALHFKKIRCSALGVVKLNKRNQQWVLDKNDLETSIKTEITRVKNTILADPDVFRSKKGVDDGFTITDADLISDDAYKNFIKSLKTIVVPNWEWNINFELSSSSSDTSSLQFAFEFTNNSHIPAKSANVDGFFFDPLADFTFDNIDVFPFEVDLARKGFRYDQNIWTKGFNCGIKKLSNNSFQTTSVPAYLQKRFKTKQISNTTFERLGDDPLPILEQVSVEMRKYLEVWDSAEKEYKQKFPDWVTNEYSKEFLKDKSVFIHEIERFDEGLALIKNNPDVLLAFKLTNQTFERAGLLNNPPKIEWRLFQLVFLVSQIPDIALLADASNAAERRKYVDIIYFPTGGGKTEAYLSVIVFNCFFDRLRGKQAGNTAWLRFSLRLLTLQQTQRMADVIGISELLRRESPDPRLSGVSISEFAVGYFVGEASTPNELKEKNYETGFPDQNWLKAKSPKDRQSWKRIVRCPSCGTKSVTVDFDEKNARILHRCINEKCKFPEGIVPIYIVDNEIYRYLPAVIVGTIDKLAMVGTQQKISLILGKVDGKCQIHGFYNGKKCLQKGCNNQKLMKTVPEGVSGPTLFIQDELHLIKEGLGTFDSHYETFFQTLLELFGNKQPLKIIASSATIEAFDRQVEHLYSRDSPYARIFPGFGPTLENSFYAETLDETQRIFLGIIPHNKTIDRAVIEFIHYYQVLLDELKRTPSNVPNPYGGNISPGSAEWDKIVDLYSTSLYYFQKTSTLDSIGTNIKNAINPELSKNGIPPINFAELTGGISSDDVAKTLEKLEAYDPHNADNIDLVLATSMVSHGVDINRLNAMVFYGMTRSNAEYIQASSRVGRTHTGLVFDFFKPILERDQSYYAYFYKYHEFLGQLVEPVAINRWSKFSIERTLPGLFMGVLLQNIATNQTKNSPGSYYQLNFIKQKIDSGEISADDFLSILEKSYLRDSAVQESVKTFVRNEISRLIDFYLFDSIISARVPAGSSTFVSNALIPPPMRSLRDIDEKIEISLDTKGWKWIPQKRRR